MHAKQQLYKFSQHYDNSHLIMSHNIVGYLVFLLQFLCWSYYYLRWSDDQVVGETHL